jgi:hypothetical protein
MGASYIEQSLHKLTAKTALTPVDRLIRREHKPLGQRRRLTNSRTMPLSTTALTWINGGTRHHKKH